MGAQPRSPLKWKSAFACCNYADAYLFAVCSGTLFVSCLFLLLLSTLMLLIFHAFKRLRDVSSEQYRVSAVFGPCQCLKYPHNCSTSCLCDLVHNNAGVHNQICPHVNFSPSCSFPPQPSCSDRPANIPGCPPRSHPAPAASAFVGHIVGTLLVIHASFSRVKLSQFFQHRRCQFYSLCRFCISVLISRWVIVLSIIHSYHLCCAGGPICLVGLPCWLCCWFHHPHPLCHHTNVSLDSACFRACVSHRSFIADYHTFTLPCPGFDVGPGRPPILPKLVEQIHLGEYIDFAKLLPDSLRDNELSWEPMLEHQHLVIPKHPPRRDVWDILSWIDCWIAYCQVVLNFSPSHSVELLKYLDLIVRTHRSFPSQTSGSSTIRDSGGKPHAPRHLSTGGPLT